MVKSVALSEYVERTFVLINQSVIWQVTTLILSPIGKIEDQTHCLNLLLPFLCEQKVSNTIEYSISLLILIYNRPHVDY